MKIILCPKTWRAKVHRHGILLLGILAITACSSSTQLQVSDEQRFPTPLVKPLPVAAGIYLDEVFKDYAYEEPGAKGKPPKVRIALGPAQTAMISAVLPQLFSNGQMVDAAEPSGLPADLELLIVPRLNDFQYATPKNTRSKVYEVWLQYEFDVYDRAGNSITVWKVPSYGKTPTGFLTSQADAFNVATQMALRDCGAAFATGIGEVPAFKAWLTQRDQNGPSRVPNLKTPEANSETF